MDRKLEQGRLLLKRFIEQRRTTPTEIGRAMHVRHSAVLGWLSGVYEPDATNRRALEKLTEGAVPYESWPASMEEAERIARIQPFQRSA